MPVKKGDKVKVHYKGTLEDGSEFDNSEKHGKPIEFEVGSGQVIKGFEEAVVGMDKDQTKDITLKPEEAYGHPNDQLVQKIPKERIPKDPEPKEGMVLMVGFPDGRQAPATIKSVSENDVELDMNHPLAGKTLNFNLKVVGVNE